MSDSMETEILHFCRDARFEAHEQGRKIGELTYVIDRGTLTVKHTFVNEDCRGRGIAQQMISAAETFAEKEGLKIAATCSYAAAALPKP